MIQMICVCFCCPVRHTNSPTQPSMNKSCAPQKMLSA